MESAQNQFRDAAPYRTAFHRPVVEGAEAGDDLDAGDAAPYRAALHRFVEDDKLLFISKPNRYPENEIIKRF